MGKFSLQIILTDSGYCFAARGSLPFRRFDTPEIQRRRTGARTFLRRMHFLFSTCTVYICAQGVQWVYQSAVCSKAAV